MAQWSLFITDFTTLVSYEPMLVRKTLSRMLFPLVGLQFAGIKPVLRLISTVVNWLKSPPKMIVDFENSFDDFSQNFVPHMTV